MGGRESSCGDAAVWQLCRQLFMGRFDLIKSCSVCMQDGAESSGPAAEEGGVREQQVRWEGGNHRVVMRLCGSCVDSCLWVDSI